MSACKYCCYSVDSSAIICPACGRTLNKDLICDSICRVHPCWQAVPIPKEETDKSRKEIFEFLEDVLLNGPDDDRDHLITDKY